MAAAFRYASIARYGRVHSLLLPLVTFCIASTTAPGEDTTISPIEPILRELREKHSLPGLTAAVVRGDKVEAAAVGARSTGGDGPIQIDDRFHIASCTKSMTAMMVEEGKMSWDTSVGDRLPELKGKVRDDYLSVRLEQLLAHTGGIPAYTNFGQERLGELLAIPGTNTAQRLTFVTQVLAEPPVASPGSHAVYSNAGYALAAAMIERAAGNSWEDLMRERVFRPLQMESAGFGWPATMARPHQPRGHRSEDDGKSYVPQPLNDACRRVSGPPEQCIAQSVILPTTLGRI